MYRTYEITEKEAGKKITSFWDGDTYIYTVYENDEEYKAEQERHERIQREYEEHLKRELAK